MQFNVILSGMLLAVCISLNAQKNVIKASISTVGGGVQYERVISQRISLAAHVGYVEVSVETDRGESTSRSRGLGYCLEGRYYLLRNHLAPEGWHAGVFFSSIMAGNQENEQSNISSLGLATGYQWIGSRGLSVGAVLGLGTLWVNSDVELIDRIEAIGFLPHLGVHVGYAF